MDCRHVGVQPVRGTSMKKMPWFRMYSEAVDDEKLRLIAFEDRWHFVAILCCKCAGVLDSDDPLLRRKIAVKLGLGIRELDEVARRLSEVGLIDFETMQPLNWDERQFQSDSSTDRVKAYRERMKREGNVSVTAQETETETDTETDTEKKTKAPGKPARFDPLAFHMPPCIPADAWKEWIAYRRSRKLTVSEKTIKAQVAKLAEWHAAGHQPADIISTSITNGWQGLFEPKTPASVRTAARDERSRAHYDRSADTATMMRQIEKYNIQPYDGEF